MLEPDDEVIGEPHDDNVAVGMPASPLPDPPVEQKTEIARYRSIIERLACAADLARVTAERPSVLMAALAAVARRPPGHDFRRGRR